MKKLLLFGIVSLLIFLIYLTTTDSKIYYLSLGDSIATGRKSDGGHQDSFAIYIKQYLKKQSLLETYIDQFTEDDQRISDLIRLIEDNYAVKTEKAIKKIKHTLIKADLVSVAIGSDALFQKINANYTKNELYDFVDENMKDMEQLIILIKQYCKEDVVFIGYYNPYQSEVSTEIIRYANQQLQELTNEYKLGFFNPVSFLTSEYFSDLNDYHFIDKGHQLIANQLIENFVKNI